MRNEENEVKFLSRDAPIRESMRLELNAASTRNDRTLRDIVHFVCQLVLRKSARRRAAEAKKEEEARTATDRPAGSQLATRY